MAIYPTKFLQPSTDRELRASVGIVDPESMVYYFDAVTKIWKPLPSVVRLGEETQSCFSAEIVGNYMYLAARGKSGHRVYRYHIVNNNWETLPPFENVSHKIDCLCSVNDYIYAVSESNPPQRYSLANNNWQSSGAKLSFFNTSNDNDRLITVAAVVLKSKIYAVHGYRRKKGEQRYYHMVDKPAVVHCFDPAKNEWKQKASTCQPHFGSGLFVVNNSLYVAGGRISCYDSGNSCGNPAPVEVYNEANNTWSVVEQKHIPPNDLGAVEIEGRVYFIINKFPVDSGIRIPPGEVYQVSFKEWKNFTNLPETVDETDDFMQLAEQNGTALCYLPVKRESLKKTEQAENQTD